jgi:hypothetical protein
MTISEHCMRLRPFDESFHEVESNFFMEALWWGILARHQNVPLWKSSDRSNIHAIIFGEQGLRYEGLAEEHIDQSCIKIQKNARTLTASETKLLRVTVHSAA